MRYFSSELWLSLFFFFLAFRFSDVQTCCVESDRFSSIESAKSRNKYTLREGYVIRNSLETAVGPFLCITTTLDYAGPAFQVQV